MPPFVLTPLRHYCSEVLAPAPRPWWIGKLMSIRTRENAGADTIGAV